MLQAGIKKQFGVHSTRAAAISTAKMKGVPNGTIIQTAGWANSRTFSKFYRKHIEEQQGPTFEEAILS